jgi:hypothetical protein
MQLMHKHANEIQPCGLADAMSRAVDEVERTEGLYMEAVEPLSVDAAALAVASARQTLRAVIVEARGQHDARRARSD